MSFLERLAGVEEGIQQACKVAGRSRDEVCLIGVSKTFPLDSIHEAYQAGLRDFGESRLGELVPKAASCPPDISWHFVGPCQSNKVRRIAEICTLIHSIDSESQLRELAKLERKVDILVQVNIAEEPQKSGIFPGGLDKFIETVLRYETVQLRGLMTIGPAEVGEDETRRNFRRMRTLFEATPGDILSMGMSGDFEWAIQEGSTHIRVGSALFGER